MKFIIDVNPRLIRDGFERPFTEEEKNVLIKAIGNATALIDLEQKVSKGIDEVVECAELLRRRLIDATFN